MNPYYLSVCMVVRNEAPFIEEQLEFHLLQGVSHFYIYDNGSTDGTLEILKRYESLGIVTLRELHVRPVQFVAYNDALERYKEETEWIAFIDTDEFLVGINGNDIVSHLEGLNSDVAAFAVHWLIFGSSGYLKEEPGLVIERFTRRQRHTNQHVKSIVRPYLVTSVGKNPHTFRAKPHTRIVDENGDELPAEYARIPGSTEKFALFHYHVKSKEEYFKRKIGNQDSGSGKEYTPENALERFIAHDVNDVRDFTAKKYGKLVREKIEARRKESLS